MCNAEYRTHLIHRIKSILCHVILGSSEFVSVIADLKLLV